MAARRPAARESSAVIGIDPLNEPSWGTYSVYNFERDRLVPLYNDVASAVREIAPQWIIFAEPSSSRNIGLRSNIASLPFDNAMYAPHSYDSGAESGSGFDPAHRAADPRQRQAARAGSDHDARRPVDRRVRRRRRRGRHRRLHGRGVRRRRGLSRPARRTGPTTRGGYGLTDANDDEVPAIVDAVVRPYPAYVAGTPSSYAFDAMSQAFTLTYSPDRSSNLPTEIAIPPRLYPSGYTVDCGGCTWHTEVGAVSIDTPPPGDPAIDHGGVTSADAAFASCAPRSSTVSAPLLARSARSASRSRRMWTCFARVVMLSSAVRVCASSSG